MVVFTGGNRQDSTSLTIRRCGVEVSFDDQGTPHPAIARTVLHDDHARTRKESKIAFTVRDGIAQLVGFVEPDQPSIPHFKTVPIACEQVATITDIRDVEPSSETVGRHFAHGRQLSQSED